MNFQIDDAYGALLTVLRSSGLAWVAAQIEAEVREGHVLEKVVSKGDVTLREPSSLVMEAARGSVGFTNAPLGPGEQFRLALDAIERSVVDYAALYEAAAQILDDQRTAGDRLSPGVLFVDEDEEEAHVVVSRAGPSDEVTAEIHELAS